MTSRGGVAAALFVVLTFLTPKGAAAELRVQETNVVGVEVGKDYPDNYFDNLPVGSYVTVIDLKTKKGRTIRGTSSKGIDLPKGATRSMQ